MCAFDACSALRVLENACFACSANEARLVAAQVITGLPPLTLQQGAHHRTLLSILCCDSGWHGASVRVGGRHEALACHVCLPASSTPPPRAVRPWPLPYRLCVACRRGGALAGGAGR